MCECISESGRSQRKRSMKVRKRQKSFQFIIKKDIFLHLFLGAQECLIAAGPQIDCRGSQFTYDKVFGYSVEQTEIYNQTVEPMLASLLDGFNQTVFAYGQTGSGKTYTMGGEFGKRDREHDGILPRVAEDLFER